MPLTVLSALARVDVDPWEVRYELCYAIEDFADAPLIQSDILKRLVIEFNRAGIPIGATPTEVRLVSGSAGFAPDDASQPPVATRLALRP